jgi:uncharacterized membrane protein
MNSEPIPLKEKPASAKTGLYLIAGFYILCGLIHFFQTSFYIPYMPGWLAPQRFWLYFSGLVEIALGILILVPRLQTKAAWAIILMLFLYLFLIHIPITMQFFKAKSPAFNLSMIRNPIQLLLIYWAYLYTK